MSSELEAIAPCPFCDASQDNGSLDAVTVEGAIRYLVQCCLCGASTYNVTDANEAVRLWNTRAARPVVKLPQRYSVDINLIGEVESSPEYSCKNGEYMRADDVRACLREAGVTVET